MTEITKQHIIALKQIIFMNLNLSKIHFEPPRSKTTEKQLDFRLF